VQLVKPAIGAVVALVVTIMAHVTALQAQVKPAVPTLGTLAGVVYDTAGRPAAGSEVSVPFLKRSVKTDRNGNFTLDSIAPGNYEVWIRRLGYNPAQFAWPAKANTRVEISVTMHPLPHTLDPVEVWAEEEKSMKRNSMVSGVVVDAAGNPMGDVEVSLLGTGRTTVTAADGSFAFRHVSDGNLTVRTRYIGYSPALSRIKLMEDDERKVYLRMTPLAQDLDEVNVTARSGYGPEELAWRDFDQRMRWRGQNNFAFTWSEEDLKKFESQPLDLLMHGRTPQAFSARGKASFGNGDTAPKTAFVIDGDVCILENGARPIKRPLRAYDAGQVETIEFYPATPPETEFTRTLEYRFANVQGCAKDEMGNHPAWYVLWFKGAR
jgi:hypothetical protein